MKEFKMKSSRRNHEVLFSCICQLNNKNKMHELAGVLEFNPRSCCVYLIRVCGQLNQLLYVVNWAKPSKEKTGKKNKRIKESCGGKTKGAIERARNLCSLTFDSVSMQRSGLGLFYLFKSGPLHLLVTL